MVENSTNLSTMPFTSVKQKNKIRHRVVFMKKFNTIIASRLNRKTDKELTKSQKR